MWIGWLALDGRWCVQPSTRSRDAGTCSKRLTVLARAAGLPATHEIMTGGGIPRIPPPQRRRPCEQAAPDLEEKQP